ncbi:hypothetical protein IR151_17565 [Clostridioides sp. ES-S-0006-03]|uniref:terminase large subunit domain-containing protein n=1 Tax=Clostridioides sp. ES-S-0006-03 TaxID=2770775 RepID=UPI001D0CA7A6|nr:hypothetical protein [Clostridioides sp. ES-S-0006-03]
MVTKSRQRKLKYKDSYDNLIEGIGIWTSFYRENPHRFVLDYLRLKLYPFQMLLLYMMNVSTKFCFIACRGLGKSTLVAIFCIVRCILYPGSKIVIAAGSKQQAGLIITDKIATMKRESIALDKEILDISTGQNRIECIFKNGSIIQASVSGDGARGKRAQVVIVDEYRTVKKNDIDTVLKQFLTDPRHPGFLDKPEYKDYPLEPNKELYLSSAWYKSHWSWDKFIDITKDMCSGKSAFSCDIPYICSLDNRLLLKEKIDEDRVDIGEVAFLMEYCGIWYGENEKSYFKSSEMNQCRVLKTPFYPLKDYEYCNKDERRKKKKQMVKKNGEIRIIGADIAVEEGANNDNSIYTLMRLLPNTVGYTREVVWIESHNGLDPEKQALRLKQLFFDFEADKMIVDTNGNGTSVMTELQKTQYDEARDEHYEALTAYNRNPDIDLALSKGAKPVVYALKAYAKENNDIAVYLKNSFVTKKIRLLIDDTEKRQNLMLENKKFEDKSAEEQADILIPFLQTTMMVHETINLEYELLHGNIRIVEKGKARKDRYSSIAYANYLAQLIENEEFVKKKKGTNKYLFLT